MNRGQVFVIGMLVLALAAAASSFLWRRVQTREALEFWGPAAAQRIASPQRVEALLLRPLADSSNVDVTELVRATGQEFQIVRSREVTKAPGFTNARHALTKRQSFNWQAAPALDPEWRYALRFSDDSGETIVLFSSDFHLTRLSDRAASVNIEPIAKGLATVFGEQLGSS